MDNEKWFRVMGGDWDYWSNVKEAVLRGLIIESHPEAGPNVPTDVVNYLKREFHISCQAITPWYDNTTEYYPEVPFSDRTIELLRWYHNSKDMEV